MLATTNPKTATAVYALSADPITYGHINIVERMANSFSHCVVGIGRNPLKRYLFSIEERTALAKAALAHLPNVAVYSFDGMMVDFAFEHGAQVIVKGVRNAVDVDYEQTLHQVGVSQQMGIDTHILFADPKLGHVSSSVVKGMQMEHGFIHDYVPPMVKAALEAKISTQVLIGLTGSIASGKSTLAKALVKVGAERGVPVHDIDLDHIGHQVLAGDGIGEVLHASLRQQLVTLLGHSILIAHKLDRKRIAERIFADDHVRKQFNALMEKPMALLLRRALKDKKGVILLNSALLPDLGLLPLCNFRCVLCDVDEVTQQSRLAQRGYGADHALMRLTAQQSGQQKRQQIELAIAEARFGQLWLFEAGNLSAAQLFEHLLADIPEALCLSNP